VWLRRRTRGIREKDRRAGSNIKPRRFERRLITWSEVIGNGQSSSRYEAQETIAVTKNVQDWIQIEKSVSCRNKDVVIWIFWIRGRAPATLQDSSVDGARRNVERTGLLQKKGSVSE